MVEISAVLYPSWVNRFFKSVVTVVFPLVPVTPINLRFAEGLS